MRARASWAVCFLFFIIPGSIFADQDTRSDLTSVLDSNSSSIASNTNEKCQNPRTHFGFPDSCSFIRAHPQCRSGGAIEYTEIFFCRFGSVQWLGYTLMFIWLLALFYMLGNTAADYFCCSLQKLSSLLHLPPTLAGVTLLPLGNGAPDVFASIAAFMGTGAGEVGLNSVLGGAVFVTCVVAGLVYVITSGKSVDLDRGCFIRDVVFFLFALLSLLLILHVGKVTFWGAIAFVSIYLVYAVSVAASEVLKKQVSKLKWQPMQAWVHGEDEESWYSPLMDPESGSNAIEITLPQWRWASNVAIYAHQVPEERPLWGWSEEQEVPRPRRWIRNVVDIVLTLPRQLTIPIVEENRWSKPVGVASVGLAPVLFTIVVCGVHWKGLILSSIGVGASLALIAGLTTSSEHPPRKFVFPWVAGGFFMSIVWFYVVANELVAALVSLGMFLEVDSAVLGVTVLAWGNSMGDLMANVMMAHTGGDSVQVAVSGSYAGPMFNTLVGLGMSLVLASLRVYPTAFVLPKDGSLYYTIGFLVVGLLWTLVVLTGSRMKPGRVLGIGLLVLYCFFLGFRLLHSVSGSQ